MTDESYSGIAVQSNDTSQLDAGVCILFWYPFFVLALREAADGYPCCHIPVLMATSSSKIAWSNLSGNSSPGIAHQDILHLKHDA